MTENEKLVRQLIRANPDKPYVYGLFRPCGEIFYVGKGINRRVLVHGSKSDLSNPYKINIINAIRKNGEDIVREIFKFFETHEEAIEYEEFLISKYKRVTDGGTLVNVLENGFKVPDNIHGSSKEEKYRKMVETRRRNGNYKHTEETLKVISKMVRAAGATPAKVAACKRRIGKKLPPKSEEAKRKVGLSNSKKPLILSIDSEELMFRNQSSLFQFLSTKSSDITINSMKNLTRQIKAGRLFFGFDVRYATEEEVNLLNFYTL